MEHHNKGDKIQTLLVWMVTVIYAIFALWIDSRVWLFFTGYFVGFAIFRTLTPSYDFWTEPYHKLIRVAEKIIESQRIEIKTLCSKLKGKKKNGSE